jgi:S-(hydroxymethyl)glutathione dehydrogenase/alcohol dehydrogenase
VIACLSVFCGHCEYCLTGRTHLCQSRPVRAATEPPKLSWKGEPVNQFANLSSYAEQMLVHESGLVKVRDDMPLDRAALIGCGVTTGVGAVLNTARVEPGTTVAVYGAGGVGLAAIQGAVIAGARMIIAVDVVAHKLETAKTLGATHAVDASTADPVKAIRELTGPGVDYAFEAIGLEQTIQAAWEAARPGGTAVVVGLMPKGRTLTIDPWGFINEKVLRGCFLGTAQIERDIPRLVELVQEGELELEGLVSRRIRLEELPQAFDRLRAGDAVRQLVVFDG